jgi:hypothetical protein
LGRPSVAARPTSPVILARTSRVPSKLRVRRPQAITPGGEEDDLAELPGYTEELPGHTERW